MLKRAVIVAVAVLFTSTLIGCAGDRERSRRAQAAAPELYDQAQRAMRNANYSGAVELFERLESRFPFSKEAQQASLEIIYAHYKVGNHEQAQAASDRFLREQPRHPDIDYVHYLRGVIAFDRGLNILDTLMGVDPAKRDSSLAQQSFRSFNTLVTNYPESKYVPDARQRMVHLRNQIARHEVYVADYYMRLGAYVAAAARARGVLEQYDETPSVIDALVILHNAYRRLDMGEAADATARTLIANHPAAAARLSR